MTGTQGSKNPYEAGCQDLLQTIVVGIHESLDVLHRIGIAYTSSPLSTGANGCTCTVAALPASAA